jgi:hypothetical protein
VHHSLAAARRVYRAAFLSCRFDRPGEQLGRSALQYGLEQRVNWLAKALFKFLSNAGGRPESSALKWPVQRLAHLEQRRCLVLCNSGCLTPLAEPRSSFLSGRHLAIISDMLRYTWKSFRRYSFCDWQRDLPQIATLLSRPERQRFGVILLDRAEHLLSQAATADEERRVRAAILRALSQPSLNRLRAYADGDYFPTTKVVLKLASALGFNALVTLRAAGYDAEVVRKLHDLRVSARAANDELTNRTVIACAVRLFPRRGEQYRLPAVYQAVLLEKWFDLAINGPSHRPLARPLARACDVLGDAALTPDCRRSIAGELMRAWAYDVNAALTRDIEQAEYLRVPTVGEPPPILPFPPIRSQQ